jgi:hypothetical protein
MDKNDSFAVSCQCRPVRQHARPAHAARLDLIQPSSPGSGGRPGRGRPVSPAGGPQHPGGPGRRHIIITPGNRSQGGEGST